MLPVFLIAMAIPLVLSWVFTILTLVSIKRHAKTQKHRAPAGDYDRSMEQRLSKTLALMIGVFTISILPAALVCFDGIYDISEKLASSYSDNTIQTPGKYVFNASTGYETGKFISVILLPCNSLWNIFIYHFRNPDFRSFYRSQFQRVLSAKIIVCQ